MFEIVARLGHDNKASVVITVKATNQSIETILHPDEAVELCRRLLKSADVAHRLTRYIEELPRSGAVQKSGSVETLGDA